jgi:hypothetical protein
MTVCLPFNRVKDGITELGVVAYTQEAWTGEWQVPGWPGQTLHTHTHTHTHTQTEEEKSDIVGWGHLHHPYTYEGSLMSQDSV